MRNQGKNQSINKILAVNFWPARQNHSGFVQKLHNKDSYCAKKIVLSTSVYLCLEYY